MSCNRVSIFILPFLLMVFVVSGWAQSTGSIQGVINDTEDRPIPGVAVTISSKVLTGGPRTAYTNEQGAFQFSSVPVGTYSVDVTVAGFEKVHREIEVRASETANVNLNLKITSIASLTVTATKREEQLKDVPFSVAAPTSDLLAARGVENIEGIAEIGRASCRERV